MSSSPTLVKVSSVLGVTVAIFLLDWFYVAYLIAHGFEVKAQELTVGGLSFSIPLQWLPVLGIVIMSLVAWYEVSARIFPRRAGPEIDPLARLRLMRVVAFSITIFVCVLYIPYLVGSNWFWARLSEFGRSVSQVRDFGQSLLPTVESAVTLYPLWQYSLSQVLASGAMVFVAWVVGRVAKRPRKPR